MTEKPSPSKAKVLIVDDRSRCAHSFLELAANKRSVYIRQRRRTHA
jgi:hypothetical protein